jgi:Rrf2 family iron-sulfur cluster assembly transcriptional regulator
MIEIAITDNSKGILQKEISKNQNISRKYLDQIIVALKSSGMIDNSAGRGGGYKLGKKAENKSVYDIYKSFESDLKVVDGLDEDCMANNSCAAMDYWKDLNSHITTHMQSVTLKELAERQRYYSQQNPELDFVI